MLYIYNIKAYLQFIFNQNYSNNLEIRENF